MFAQQELGSMKLQRVSGNSKYYFIGLISVCSAAIAHSAESSHEISGNLIQTSYTSSDQIFFRSDQVSNETTTFELNYSHNKLLTEESLFKVDFNYIYSANENSHNINVRELYYQNIRNSWSFIVGQNLHTWSRADETWARGLWQPRFFWDKLHPQSQGLMGLQSIYKIEKNEFRVFCSGVHFPELGPKFDVNSNGEFKSPSPWFRPPPETVEMLGQQVTNFYTYQDPELSEMLLKPSIALTWDRTEEEYFIKVAYAYKPMNQVVISSPSLFDSSTNTLDVIIIPETQYHHISTLEAGVANKRGWTYWLSAIKDEPFPNDKPLTWISQQIDQAFVWTAYLGYSLGGNEDKASSFFVTYSYVDGGDAKDRGDNALDYSYYERRYQYTNSLRVGFKHPQGTLFNRALDSSAALTYDSEQNVMLFSTKMNWQYKNNIKIIFEADILGLLSESESARDGGVLIDYRANDRVGLGASYVF